MHWFWWVVIVYVALIILNALCTDNPGFRHVLCCIMSIVYPIITIVNLDDPDSSFALWAIFGPLTVAFYKFVYGLAEMIENDGSGDVIGTFFILWTNEEVTVLSIIISIVVCVVFAAIPIALFFIFREFSNFLACVSLFLPFIYCLIGAIRYFGEEY